MLAVIQDRALPLVGALLVAEVLLKYVELAGKGLVVLIVPNVVLKIRDLLVLAHLVIVRRQELEGLLQIRGATEHLRVIGH